MASVEDKINYLRNFRDQLAMSFLQESLSKGNTIQIPSIGINIVPLRCGTCNDGFSPLVEGRVVCSEDGIVRGSETVCVLGKTETVER